MKTISDCVSTSGTYILGVSVTSIWKRVRLSDNGNDGGRSNLKLNGAEWSRQHKEQLITKDHETFSGYEQADESY